MDDDRTSLDALDLREAAQRAPMEVVRRQSDRFRAMSGLRGILDAIPSVLLILNEHRQIIYANRHVAGLLGLASPDSIYGLRPGELLDCDHVGEAVGGCGTCEACKTCGTARAITICQRGTASVQECRMTQQRTGRAVDLRISTTPFDIEGERYVVMSMTDISHEKRRLALERIFFHDLLNTAGSVMGYAELLDRAKADEVDGLKSTVARLAATMVDEIRAQRELVAAEGNDLYVDWQILSSRAILRDVLEMYRSHEAGRDRLLIISADAADVQFPSDKALLTRVISNMTRNALEASHPGQMVTLSCSATDDSVEFTVHNVTSMPRDVQLQVFRRSFSTRGAARGLGTYSIKLLTERYLKGTVSFTSSPEMGTTFRVRYPRSVPAKP